MHYYNSLALRLHFVGTDKLAAPDPMCCTCSTWYPYPLSAAHDVFIYQVSFQCAASAAYVNHNVQHQGMLHVFRVYLGATIAALFQQIAFPLIKKKKHKHEVHDQPGKEKRLHKKLWQDFKVSFCIKVNSSSFSSQLLRFLRKEFER